MATLICVYIKKMGLQAYLEPMGGIDEQHSPALSGLASAIVPPSIATQGSFKDIVGALEALDVKSTANEYKIW